MSKSLLFFFQVGFSLLLVSLSGCSPDPLLSSSAPSNPIETTLITPTTSPASTPMYTPIVTRVVPSTYLPTLPVSSITGDVSDQSTREEIIRRLATIWLDYFTGKDLPDNVRLHEYRLISAKVYDNQYLQCLPGTHEDEFRTEIMFSFKVVDRLYNPWNAGGGNISDDDPLWTIGKTVNPLVFRDGDVYTWEWDWSCTNTPSPAYKPAHQSTPGTVGGLFYAPSLTIATGETLTQQEIAEALFTSWLTHFKDVGQEDARYKIDDYEVIQVTIPEELQSCSNKLGAEFVATGIFSVKPTDKLASGWFAGGGNISDDQLWITKSHDVAIFLVNGVYSWKLLEVPPCW
ncbi:MAG: hypothetical protein ACOYY3_07255 [Chloroflexota bacterium]